MPYTQANTVIITCNSFQYTVYNVLFLKTAVCTALHAVQDVWKLRGLHQSDKSLMKAGFCLVKYKYFEFYIGTTCMNLDRPLSYQWQVIA